MEEEKETEAKFDMDETFRSDLAIVLQQATGYALVRDNPNRFRCLKEARVMLDEGMSDKDKEKHNKIHSDLKKDVDVMLSMGGDGTFLATLKFIRDSLIPVLGINTGRLGFLANVAEAEIGEAVDALLNKKFKNQRRFASKNEFGRSYYNFNNKCYSICRKFRKNKNCFEDKRIHSRYVEQEPIKQKITQNKKRNLGGYFEKAML